jgi:hypothetical protein
MMSIPTLVKKIKQKRPHPTPTLPIRRKPIHVGLYVGDESVVEITENANPQLVCKAFIYL